MPTASFLSRVVFLIPFLSLAAAGQAPTSNWENLRMIAPGTEVRVAAGNSKPVRGRLENVSDDSLAIQADTGTRSFPRPEIRGVFVRKNRDRLRKVLIGMGIGTSAGLGIGGAVANNCTGIACGGYSVAMGGLIGLAGGVVAGLVWSRGEWRQVYTQ
jgi:hypothetical protein